MFLLLTFYLTLYINKFKNIVGGVLKRTADAYLARGHGIPDAKTLFNALIEAGTRIKLIFATLLGKLSYLKYLTIYRLRLQNLLISAFFLDLKKNLELVQSRSTGCLNPFDFSDSFSKTAQSFVNSCSSGVFELAHSELLIRRNYYSEFIELCS